MMLHTIALTVVMMIKTMIAKVQLSRGSPFFSTPLPARFVDESPIDKSFSDTEGEKDPGANATQVPPLLTRVPGSRELMGGGTGNSEGLVTSLTEELAGS
jgi:hypothetical protein